MIELFHQKTAGNLPTTNIIFSVCSCFFNGLQILPDTYTNFKNITIKRFSSFLETIELNFVKSVKGLPIIQIQFLTFGFKHSQNYYYQIISLGSGVIVSMSACCEGGVVFVSGLVHSVSY